MYSRIIKGKKVKYKKKRERKESDHRKLNLEDYLW